MARRAPERPDDPELHNRGKDPAEHYSIEHAGELQLNRQIDRVVHSQERQNRPEMREEVFPPEQLNRRYGIDADAVAGRQFHDATQEPPIPIEELNRRFGRSDEADRLSGPQEIDEARLDVAASEIARIKYLQPEEWKHADEWHRKIALQEVNRIMGRAFECPALPLEFKALHESKDGIELGATNRDGTHTFINEKFLKTGDPDLTLPTQPLPDSSTPLGPYTRFVTNIVTTSRKSK